MYSCSPTFSQILLKNFIGKVFSFLFSFFFLNFGQVTIVAK